MNEIMRLEEELKKQKYHFHEGFGREVMTRIKAEAVITVDDFIRRWQPLIAWSAAACLVLVIGAALFTEGGISMDAFTGLSEFSEMELSELLTGI